MYWQLVMREQQILRCFPKRTCRLQSTVLQATVQQRDLIRTEVREKHIRSELGESKLSALIG